jgi:hypothetical protein
MFRTLNFDVSRVLKTALCFLLRRSYGEPQPQKEKGRWRLRSQFGASMARAREANKNTEYAAVFTASHSPIDSVCSGER